jgi:hypothetical protein
MEEEKRQIRTGDPLHTCILRWPIRLRRSAPSHDRFATPQSSELLLLRSPTTPALPLSFITTCSSPAPMQQHPLPYGENIGNRLGVAMREVGGDGVKEGCGWVHRHDACHRITMDRVTRIAEFLVIYLPAQGLQIILARTYIQSTSHSLQLFSCMCKVSRQGYQEP